MYLKCSSEQRASFTQSISTEIQDFVFKLSYDRDLKSIEINEHLKIGPVSMSEMEVNPLSIILVKSDSKGDRLLFRYPYRVESNEIQCQNKRRNPYSVPAQEDILQSPPPQTSNIHQGNLVKYFNFQAI